MDTILIFIRRLLAMATCPRIFIKNDQRSIVQSDGKYVHTDPLSQFEHLLIELDSRSFYTEIKSTFTDTILYESVLTDTSLSHIQGVQEKLWPSKLSRWQTFEYSWKKHNIQ